LLRFILETNEQLISASQRNITTFYKEHIKKNRFLSAYNHQFLMNVKKTEHCLKSICIILFQGRILYSGINQIHVLKHTLFFSKALLCVFFPEHLILEF
jgi:hypothetical protein